MRSAKPNHRQWVALALSACAALSSCDRLTGSSPAADAQAAEKVALIATNPNAPLPTSLTIESLATLTPGKPSLLAATPEGGIYVVQAAGDGASSGDVLRVENGAARPTGLTSKAVLRALGMNLPATARSDADAAPRGRFTAIAARGDNKVAFCFAGVAAARPFVAIGTFDPSADPTGGNAIFLPVDQILLNAAGDPDLATDAARPSLFTAGDDAWLWRATASNIRVLKITGLSTADPKIVPSQVSMDQARDATTSDVERSAWEWSATPRRGEFLLTDIASRWIRRIDENGTLTHVARFDAETVPILSAAAEDAAGRAIVLACGRDGIARTLLVQDAGSFKSIPLTAFTVPAPLDANRLGIDRLLPLPREANAFLAFDATSGAVICVRLK